MALERLALSKRGEFRWVAVLVDRSRASSTTRAFRPRRALAYAAAGSVERDSVASLPTPFKKGDAAGGTSLTLTGVPPPTATLLGALPAKNPTQSPSGERKDS